MIDCIRSYAPGFIFTTSIPPVVAAGAKASVNYLRHSTTERKLHKERTWQLLTKLVDANLPVMLSESHIIPLFIGDPFKCKQVSDMLLNQH